MATRPGSQEQAASQLPAQGRQQIRGGNRPRSDSCWLSVSPAPGAAWAGCYLFMCKVSPHTCARVAATRLSLPLAPAECSAKEPSGLGTWAMSTRSLRTRGREEPRTPLPPGRWLEGGVRAGRASGPASWAGPCGCLRPAPSDEPAGPRA